MDTNGSAPGGVDFSAFEESAAGLESYDLAYHPGLKPIGAAALFLAGATRLYWVPLPEVAKAIWDSVPTLPAWTAGDLERLVVGLPADYAKRVLLGDWPTRIRSCAALAVAPRGHPDGLSDDEAVAVAKSFRDNWSVLTDLACAGYQVPVGELVDGPLDERHNRVALAAITDDDDDAVRLLTEDVTAEPFSGAFEAAALSLLRPAVLRYWSSSPQASLLRFWARIPEYLVTRVAPDEETWREAVEVWLATAENVPSSSLLLAATHPWVSDDDLLRMCRISGANPDNFADLGPRVPQLGRFCSAPYAGELPADLVDAASEFASAREWGCSATYVLCFAMGRPPNWDGPHVGPGGEDFVAALNAAFGSNVDAWEKFAHLCVNLAPVVAAQLV